MSNVFLAHILFFRDHINNLMVIARDAESFRKALTKLSATRTKFSADSDDLCHFIPFLLKNNNAPDNLKALPLRLPSALDILYSTNGK